MIAQGGTLLLSESRLRHNVRLFRQRLAPRVKLGAVVKANAYGHGLNEVAPLLPAAGIEWLCVYSLAEALAAAAITAGMPILAMAPVILHDSSAPWSPWPPAWLQDERIRITLTDESSARRLAAQLAERRFPRPLSVHVQVDTGLTRHGVAADDAPRLLECLAKLPPLRLEGVFMQLSHGEEPDHPACRRQLEIFLERTDRFKTRRPELIRHAQNSGGSWHWPEAPLDLVRLGIGLYGLQPSLRHPLRDLQPVASLVAPIAALHARPRGVGVGYGYLFITARPSRLAVVPVGYADGYPRALSNRAEALVRGHRVPVVGRISMDQSVLDVTDVAVEIGDVVTLVDNDPASPLCLDRLAGLCDTIGYELATGFGPRLVRRMV